MRQLAVLENSADYPVVLTDRWGGWNFNSDSMQHAILDELDDCYGDGENPHTVQWGYAEGDPRRCMGMNESTFVAMHRGKLGILTEIETVFVRDEGEAVANGTATGFTEDTYLAPAAFDKQVQEFTASMLPIQEEFPHTELFLAHDGCTVNGRLAVCAFTPLVQKDRLEFVSPYGEGAGIVECNDKLNKML